MRTCTRDAWVRPYHCGLLLALSQTRRVRTLTGPPLQLFGAISLMASSRLCRSNRVNCLLKSKPVLLLHAPRREVDLGRARRATAAAPAFGTRPEPSSIAPASDGSAAVTATAHTTREARQQPARGVRTSTTAWSEMMTVVAAPLSLPSGDATKGPPAVAEGVAHNFDEEDDPEGWYNLQPLLELLESAYRAFGGGLRRHLRLSGRCCPLAMVPPSAIASVQPAPLPFSVILWHKENPQYRNELKNVGTPVFSVDGRPVDNVEDNGEDHGQEEDVDEEHAQENEDNVEGNAKGSHKDNSEE